MLTLLLVLVLLLLLLLSQVLVLSQLLLLVLVLVLLSQQLLLLPPLLLDEDVQARRDAVEQCTIGPAGALPLAPFLALFGPRPAPPPAAAVALRQFRQHRARPAR